jgi:predicted lysophospholipase L1 biosynthesis ABC-type transport system permease subunit
MRIREPQNSERAAPGPWLEIIGVVGNLARTAAATSEDAVLYRPLSPGTSSAFAIIHARRDAGLFAARLRNLAAQADPAIRLYDPRTLDMREELDAVLYEFMLWALGIIGAVALLLSVAGVYSLISFTLARRTTEIGIRAALGAAPGRIVAAIYSRAFMQVGLGLVAGSVPGAAIVAYGGGEATRGLGVSLGAACALAIALFIVTVTALACLAPTRRALRIEPTTALRADR